MSHIAIVEDNPDNRLLARALLEGLYDCTEYETGIEALEGMVHDVPSLVLLDISLPGMDGMETLARLRDIPTLKHLPVIALTAHAMSGDREKFLRAGFDDYVTKPIVDETILLSAIARGLEGAPAR
jgi:two-component system, cell cycle response regulator DivK